MGKEYDFIVIGSGFGGSVAAMRLASKGYSVLVLEQGKHFSPADFPSSNWNLPKYLWLPALRFFGFQKLSFYKTASIMSGTGVGGGSLVYANTLYMPPDEFFTSGYWKDYGNWKEKLAPHYKTASFMLGRTRYQGRNHEDSLLKEVADDMGAGNTFETVFVGVNFDDSGEERDPYFGGMGPPRKGCTECAGCMVGCRENAKNTLDRNYLWFAVKMGATVIAETRVEKISFDGETYTIEAGKLTSFPFRKKSVFRSRGIVLSGGALGTSDLLLRQKYKYKTLDSISELLGTGVRTNAETLCAVTRMRQKPNNGLAITSVFSPDAVTHVEVVKYPDRSNAMKWFFGLAVDDARYGAGRMWLLLLKTLANPLKFIKMLFNFNWSGSTVIFLVMQTTDNAMKFVWKRSLFGRRMKIDNSGNAKVPAFIRIGQEVMERYARKASGIPQNILLEVIFNRPTTAHILGGCPMSDDPGKGVIDSQFRLHGYPRFYVADGSVIQGNIGVNPSLTITAISEYCMSLIAPKDGCTENEIARKLKIIEEEWNTKRSGH